jgi:NTP pyrophosphatase (non-canonical NTP hydrolase)
MITIPDHEQLTVDELTGLIVQWGIDRQILSNSNPLAQSRKTIEEVHEFIEAATRYECIRGDEDHTAILNGLKDAAGDIYVTLVMAMGSIGIDMRDCIEQAYNEIKDRKGYLRADGVFVKE